MSVNDIMKHKRGQILLFSFLLLGLTGCNSASESEPVADNLTGPVTTASDTELTSSEQITTSPTELPSLEPVTYQYTSEKDVSFFEPYGYQRFSGSAGFVTKTKYASYYFQKDISEEERNRMVDISESLFTEIKKRSGIMLSDSYEIHFSSAEYSPLADDNKLYVGVSSIETEEYAVGIAKLCFGNEVNYGMLYGFGYDLADKIGTMTTEIPELSEALQIYDTEPFYLDLNYACFLDVYADESTQARVKRISVDLYRYLEKNQLLDLYQNYSSETFRNSLNQFLAANGKGAYDNTDIDGFFFYGGGKAVRLVWGNSQARYYLMDDFVPNEWSNKYSEDLLNSGYKNLRKLIVDYRRQIEYAVKKFEKYVTTLDQKTLIFTTCSGRYDLYGGYTYYGGNRYYRETVAEIFIPESVMHEYIHELLEEYSKTLPVWLKETLAYYYSYNFEMPYENNYTLKSYIDLVERNHSAKQNDASYLNDMKKIENYLGHPINFHSKEDLLCYLTGAFIVDNDYRVVYSNGDGWNKILFYHYLLSHYNEDDILTAILKSSPEEVFGKDWGTIVKEWNDWNEENYAWFSE